MSFLNAQNSNGYFIDVVICRDSFESHLSTDKHLFADAMGLSRGGSFSKADLDVGRVKESTCVSRTREKRSRRPSSSLPKERLPPEEDPSPGTCPVGADITHLISLESESEVNYHCIFAVMDSPRRQIHSRASDAESLQQSMLANQMMAGDYCGDDASCPCR